MARKNRDDDDAEFAPKKGGVGIGTILLGCLGCGALTCCLTCGGFGSWGGYTYYAWNYLPLGNFPIADLDQETKLWDFTMRLPKGMKITENDKKIGGAEDASIYIFTKADPAGASQIVATKFKLNAGPMPPVPLGSRPVTWLYVNVPKFKSDPGDPIKFDTPQMPHSCEMNGLDCGRTWKLIEHKADQFQVIVVYRYHVDGFGYLFQGSAAMGKTKEEAMKNAGPIDAAMCTFKKK